MVHNDCTMCVVTFCAVCPRLTNANCYSVFVHFCFRYAFVRFSTIDARRASTLALASAGVIPTLNGHKLLVKFGRRRWWGKPSRRLFFLFRVFSGFLILCAVSSLLREQSIKIQLRFLLCLNWRYLYNTHFNLQFWAIRNKVFTERFYIGDFMLDSALSLGLLLQIQFSCTQTKLLFGILFRCFLFWINIVDRIG